MYYLLVAAAVLPIIVLCFYIHKKDVNKEPKSLLAKLFSLGFLSAIPIVIVEIIVSIFLGSGISGGFIGIFICTFFGVGLIEEGFKWLIIKKIGFNNKEFDEIYDIIVYSVFVSLGFACIENILYVVQYGFGNALVRAILSIPGHACFAVIMGYYFSRAKINSLNKNTELYNRNMWFSILLPSLIHTMYDTILIYMDSTGELLLFGAFLIFDIAMVVICFKTVNRIATAQQNITTYIQNHDDFINISGVTPTINQTVVQNNPIINTPQTPIIQNSPIGCNFCPICGKPARGFTYCSCCGYKLK